MGAHQRYNSQELDKIKADLKKMVRREAIYWSAIFGTVSFIVLSYSYTEFLGDASMASLALTFSYGADFSMNSITRYFG